MSAQFFSFGTNDLTQTALGISRDDAGTFLGTYTAKGILEVDPFMSIDQEGVGELVLIGAQRARARRPGITVAMCGEHAGNPESIAFCQRAGLDYVSCSAFRVPVARLAAAQEAILSRLAESVREDRDLVARAPSASGSLHGA